MATAAEWIEREAFRDLFRATPAGVAAAHGIETCELAGATLIVAPACSGSSMLNRAIGLGLDEPATEDGLDAICAWFDERGADVYAPIAPAAQAAGLPDVLTQRGFEPAYAWMKFVRGVEPPDDEPWQAVVTEVGGEDAETFGRIVSEAFHLPAWGAAVAGAIAGRDGWQCYLAYDDDLPVGAGATYVSGAVGYLGLGSVLPAARGKGAQRALFAARIRAAAELGCETLVTETGEQLPGRPDYSYRNILRMGFEPEYVRPNWVRRQASPSPGMLS
jgi:GNAT superfamily N-acetyltransferase